MSDFCFSQQSSDVGKYELANRLRPSDAHASATARPSQNAVIDDQYIERDDQFLNFRVTILTTERSEKFPIVPIRAAEEPLTASLLMDTNLKTYSHNLRYSHF